MGFIYVAMDVQRIQDFDQLIWNFHSFMKIQNMVFLILYALCAVLCCVGLMDGCITTVVQYECHVDKATLVDNGVHAVLEPHGEPVTGTPSILSKR